MRKLNKKHIVDMSVECNTQDAQIMKFTMFMTPAQWQKISHLTAREYSTEDAPWLYMRQETCGAKEEYENSMHKMHAAYQNAFRSR